MGLALVATSRLPQNLQGLGLVAQAGPRGASFDVLGQATVFDHGPWQGALRAEGAVVGHGPGGSGAPVLGLKHAAAQLRWRWAEASLGVRRVAQGSHARAPGPTLLTEATLGLQLARRNLRGQLRVGTRAPLGPLCLAPGCPAPTPHLTVAISERLGPYRFGGGGRLALRQAAVRAWLHSGPWQLQTTHQVGLQSVHRASVAYRGAGLWASVAVGTVAQAGGTSLHPWMGRVAGGASLGFSGLFATAATVRRAGPRGASLRTQLTLGLRRPVGGHMRLAIQLGAQAQPRGVRPRLGASLQSMRFDLGLSAAADGPGLRPRGQLRLFCRF